MKVVRSMVIADDGPAMFPGLAKTPDGLVVSFSTTPDGMPGGCVGITRSSDGGRTWTPRVIVAEPLRAGEAVINQIGIQHLSSGDLLMPFCRVRIQGGYAAREATLHVARSRDQGRTWEIGAALALDFHEPLTYGSIIEVAPDELLMPIWGRAQPSERWRSAVIRSIDGGATWDREAVTVAYDPEARLTGSYTRPRSNAVDDSGNPVMSNVTDPDFRPHAAVDGYSETSLATLSDGRIVAILRQQGVAGATELWFYRSESTDGGRRWSAPDRMTVEGMSPAAFVTRAGDLVLGYRACAPEPGGRSAGVEVIVSRDAGRSWSAPLRLVDPKGYQWTSEYQVGYPAFAELDDATLFVAFYSFDPVLPTPRYVAGNVISLDEDA